jgi:hypothetical protein
MRKKIPNKLGPIVAVYRDRPLRWRDLFTTFIPAGIAVLTPVGYGIWRTYYGYIHYGIAAAQAWGPPWFKLATVALIPLLILAIIRVRRAHRVIIVFKDGLYIQGTWGLKRLLSWSQINGITSATIQDTFIRIPIRTRHKGKLYTNEGKPIRLDSQIPDLAELTSRIKAKLYPRLLPQLRARFQNGETLDFGPVLINQYHILINPGKRFNSKQYLWPEIKNIKLNAGHLLLEIHDRRAMKLPVNKIVNAELLIQIIKEGVVV